MNLLQKTSIGRQSRRATPQELKIRRAWLDRQWFNKVAQQVVVVGHGKTYGLWRIFRRLQTADWQIS
jgi:hypothetical protein